MHTLKLFDRYSIVVIIMGIAGICVTETVAECFRNICLEKNYNIDILPNHSRPIEVDMKYDVDKVIAVDTDMNVVGMQISITQTWMDNRIYFSDQGNKIKDGQWIAAPRRMFKEPDNLPKIWIPSIWVFSMTSFEVKKTYEDQSYLAIERVNNSSPLLKQHDPSGRLEHGYFVHYLTQIDVYVQCAMGHNKFPFETHVCNISITSQDQNKQNLIFNTTPDATWNVWTPNIENKQNTRYFNVKILQSYTYDIEYDDDDLWSVTGFKIQLTRRRSEFLLNFMFPSGLCVIISWELLYFPGITLKEELQF